MIIAGKKYRELRCKNDACRKLFCFEYIVAGRLAYICPRCGLISTFDFTYLKTVDNLSTMEKEFEVKKLKGGE